VDAEGDDLLMSEKRKNFAEKNRKKLGQKQKRAASRGGKIWLGRTLRLYAKTKQSFAVLFSNELKREGYGKRRKKGTFRASVHGTGLGSKQEGSGERLERLPIRPIRVLNMGTRQGLKRGWTRTGLGAAL